MPKTEIDVWEKVYASLNEGNAARDLDLNKEEEEIIKQISLLTHKPIVYLCNTDAEAMEEGDNYLSKEFKAYIKENEPRNPVITLSAELEFEASVIKNDGKSEDDKKVLFNEYLEAYGQTGSKLSDLMST